MSRRYLGRYPEAFLLCAVSFLFFLWQLCPGVFWLDSAEFVAAGSRATLPHPPGSPLFLALARVFSLLPFGSFAFACNVMSAFFAAAALGAMQYASGLLLEGGGSTVRWPRAFSFVLLCCLALSEAWWFQAVRTEVYALQFAVNAALVLLAMKACLFPEHRNRAWQAAAFVWGLGLANHHYLTLLLVPALLLGHSYSFRQARVAEFDSAGKAFRAYLLELAGLIPAVLLGMVPYLILVFRAGTPGELSWMGSGLSGLLDFVSARAFHLSITEMPRAPFWEACLNVFSSWYGLLGPWFVLVGLAGLGSMFVFSRRHALFLSLLLIAGVFSKAIMYLDTDNPDDHAYFMIGLQALAFSGIGLPLAVVRLPPRLPPLTKTVLAALTLWLVALLFVVSLAQARVSFLEKGLASFVAPDVVNRTMLEKLPPSTLFLPSYYPLFFNHAYYREVERRRPDVVMLHQSMFSRIDGGRPYLDMKLREDPGLLTVAAAFRKTGTFPFEELLAQPRPVVLETDVLKAPDAGSLGEGGLVLPWEHTRYIGPGLRLNPSPSSAESGTNIIGQHRFWSSFYGEIATTGAMHPEFGKLLLYTHYRNALFFVNRAEWKEAAVELSLALRLFPGDRRMTGLLDRLVEKDPEIKSILK